jgi:hypothetical protein
LLTTTKEQMTTMTVRRRRPQRLVLAGLLGSLAFGAGAGCADHDRPTEYGKQRPPVDQLDPRDRGLQSADVLQASDKIIASLMASPELNQSSRKWTLVISHVEDRTRDKKFSGVDYNIFLERLRKNIAQQGRGRLALIENKDRFYDVRNKELEHEREPATGDEFGQGEAGPGGGGGTGPRPATPTNPDFGLYLTASDLPNRGTTYYLLNFIVTNLKTREQVFVDDYEVRVSRDRP